MFLRIFLFTRKPRRANRNPVVKFAYARRNSGLRSNIPAQEHFCSRLVEIVLCVLVGMQSHVTAADSSKERPLQGEIVAALYEWNSALQSFQSNRRIANREVHLS